MHKQTYNLRKKKKGVKNDLLVDGFVYTGEHKDPVRINFVQYDGLNYKQKELSTDDNLSMIFQPGKVNACFRSFRYCIDFSYWENVENAFN